MDNFDYLKEAADEINNDIAAEEAAPVVQEEVQADSSFDTEIDNLPSFLQQDEDEAGSPLVLHEDEDSQVANITEPEPEEVSSQTFQYTANGQEFQATQEEAIKALSMMKGARKAFTTTAKLKRKNQELEKLVAESGKFKNLWEEAMSSSSNAEQLWEKLSGESFQERMDRELQRRQVYAGASDTEKMLFDYEDKFENMDQQLKRFQEESTRKEQESQEVASSSRQAYAASMLQPEFDRLTHNLEDNYTPSHANKIKKMLWQESVTDYHKVIKAGYQPSDKLIKKIFEKNAKVLIKNDDKQVDGKIKAEMDRRAKVAKEQAQLASTQNYKGSAQTVNKDWTRMNPEDLFKSMTRRK